MKKAITLTLGLVLAVSTLSAAIEPLLTDVCEEVYGVIIAVDYSAQQILVCGVTIQASERTRITMRGEEIPFSFLEVGMTVRARGTWDGDVLDAKRINVGRCGN